MNKQVIYREWTILATPRSTGQFWSATAEAERPSEGGLDGPFVFSDLGECATPSIAADRAIAWTKRWIDENFVAEPGGI